jgi:hypothetical protein
MEYFFNEGKTVTIETEDGTAVELYMRFLKVKELPEYFQISEIEDEANMLARYFVLIQSKVEDEIDDNFSVHAVFNAFEKLNFSVPEDQAVSGGKVDINEARNFDIGFDFLISQGHSFSAIMEYTVPRYQYFIQAASNRMFGKPKKPDQMAFFSSMGIPVEHVQKG